MSAHPSFIKRLNIDVLWRIFDINADIFDDDTALETTLATSYVCHNWRSVLLSSTLIWAHVMDLDHPLWNSVEGSHEIIRRSGTALMWMQSCSCIDLKARLRIMKKHWERIQKLKVTIHCDVNQWTTLCRPAPHLETFSIVNDLSGYITFHNLLWSLFHGDAPMLHEFRLMSPRLTGMEMRWGQQLHSMELMANLTVDQTLAVLSSTTNLTNLLLKYTVESQFEDTLPFVSLPKLAHLDLDISNELTLGAELLEHMYIPPSCAVTLSARRIQLREVDKESTFGPVIAAISTCAQRCLAHHLPERLRVVITPTYFILKATRRSHKPFFALHMNMAPQETFPGHTLIALLKEFSLPSLSKVIYFEFRVSRIRNSKIPGLPTFMACLPSVETIATEKSAFPHISTSTPPKGGDPALRVLFPALKTLTFGAFTPPPEDSCETNKVRDPVSKYVMGRIARGQAISVIDFTAVNFDVLPNLAFLTKANGLKVLWRKSGVSGIQEHICGMSAT